MTEPNYAGNVSELIEMFSYKRLLPESPESDTTLDLVTMYKYMAEHAQIFIFDNSIEMSQDLFIYGQKLAKSEIFPVPSENFIFQIPIAFTPYSVKTRWGVDQTHLIMLGSFVRGQGPKTMFSFTEFFRVADGRFSTSGNHISVGLNKDGQFVPSWADVCENPDFTPGIKELRDAIYASTIVAVELMVILTAKGIENIFVAAPEKLNRRRAKRGKPPLRAYHIVRLPGRRSDQAAGGGICGGRNSPRRHWRRGHLRHMRSGKVTAIPPCWVGDLARGYIDKEYQFSNRRKEAVS